MPQDDPEPPPAAPPPTAADLARVAEVLEQISTDRGLLAVLDGDTRQRLLRYASQVALPDRQARRRLRKTFAQKHQVEEAKLREQDEQTLAETGIRRQYSVRQLKKPEPPRPTGREALPGPPSGAAHPTAEPPRLKRERACYICKARYDQVHHFYDALCPACAELNWTKRHQSADLTGRWAMVTGGRVKIGYQAALKLLRAGASVVVTSRFPRDAARRFNEEPDAADWRHRLQLHGLDLRHTPAVEELAAHLIATLPRLDFLLNNACQTVRRPPAFYEHLMEGERELAAKLPSEAKPLLESHEQATSKSVASPRRKPGENPTLQAIHHAAELSQLKLAPDDQLAGEALFPTGQYDHDQQQVDLRSVNSWRLRLAEVPTVELLEVHLVNAVAPFLLNARLKPLMLRHRSRDKHIVNVSAMEGVFYRAYKTDKHPHTNMAKAALNMMTRTSAQDYAADGIHMNSVDTGWITDEDPAEIAARKKEELGFHPPLDIVDAAARICDPIFDGLLTGQHVWGKFLKDYNVADW